MPCEWYKTADGAVVHVKTSRNPGRLMKCNYNYRENEGKLCDFPVGNGKTCDAAMCNECSRTLGYQHTDTGLGMKRLNDTIDVCPIHRGQAFPKPALPTLSSQ